MQSKIGVFFKSPAHVPKYIDPVSSIDGNNEELAIWEKKEHHIFITYEQRHSDRTIIQDNIEETHQTKKGIPVESCSKQESIITGRTTIKHKRRHAQFHLDFGQSDFLLHNCSICGIKFAPGDAEDEKAHEKFHKTCIQGIPFKGWTNERVVHMLNGNGGKIILIFQTDPPAQRKKDYWMPWCWTNQRGVQSYILLKFWKFRWQRKEVNESIFNHSPIWGYNFSRRSWKKSLLGE